MERRQIDEFVSQNYNLLIGKIRQYHKVTHDKAQELLHDVYLNILKNKPETLSIGYFLVGVRNNHQKKEKMIDYSLLDYGNDEGMLEMLKAKGNLFELIQKEINNDNFTYFEEAILKSRIYNETSFEKVALLIGSNKIKVFRAYKRSITKLKKIINDKYNFNSNNDSYQHQLDDNINT